MQITTIDWVILVGYMIIIAAIGLLAGLKVKDSHHYFLGARRFGKWLMIGQSFGIGTHAEMPVSLAGAVYSTGMSGIWFHWKNLFATPFYWVMAPRVQEDPSDHHCRVDRGPLRDLDGSRLHSVCAGLFYP